MSAREVEIAFLQHTVQYSYSVPVVRKVLRPFSLCTVIRPGWYGVHRASYIGLGLHSASASMNTLAGSGISTASRKAEEGDPWIPMPKLKAGCTSAEVASNAIHLTPIHIWLRASRHKIGIGPILRHYYYSIAISIYKTVLLHLLGLQQPVLDKVPFNFLFDITFSSAFGTLSLQPLA